MSTKQNIPQRLEFGHDPDIRIAIIAARWNAHITDAMLNSAIDRFAELGYYDDQIDVYRVPGTIELVHAAARCSTGAYDAVIVFGCVIKGDTPHFDYVCNSVTQGVTELNAWEDTPIIFGVLTVLNEQQALDRINGTVGDKGAEAAEAALEMIATVDDIEDNIGE